METLDKQLSTVRFDHSEAHYELIVELLNQMWASHPFSIPGAQIFDQNNSKKELLRYLFYHGQECIAYGEIRQTEWSLDPTNYSVQIIVDKNHRGCGFGSIIWDFLLALPTRGKVISLQAGTTSLEPSGIHFLHQKGFNLGTTEFVSRLSLEDWNMSTSDHPAEFVSHAELKPRGYSRKDLYNLLTTLDRDVPWHEAHEPETFAQWDHRTSKQNTVLANHSFLAISENGELIGSSELETRENAVGALYTGLTGVLKKWRRQGIAMALKKRSINSLKEARPDIKYIWTENEEENPMYVINQRLGFKRQYDLLYYQRIINSNTK